MTNIARSVIPSSLRTPYLTAVNPCGQKSLRTGYESPPRLSHQPSIENTLSVLMPKTWALSRSNSECISSYDGNWAVQTGVNAAGKNASTTFFLPR